MEKLRDSTLVFLIKKDKQNISEVCLAMKKRGFGVNRWNGVGGKVENNETIDTAAKRETEEEIGVIPKDLQKVAELSFYFPHNNSWDQLAHVYFTENWINEPQESEEMSPKWFSIKDIPFQEMWPDDEFWFPEVIKSNLIKASFIFGEKDIIKNKEVRIVESF